MEKTASRRPRRRLESSSRVDRRVRPTDRVRPTAFFPTGFHPSDTRRPSDSFTDHDRSNVHRAFFINVRKTQSEPTIAYTSTVCTDIEPTPRTSLRAVDIARAPREWN